MNRFVFPLLLAVLMFAAPLAPAFAETVAIVNIQKIMRDSLAAKSARDQLKAKQDQFAGEIKAKETDLKREDEELAKQRSVLAPDAFEQKVRTFREKAAGVQRDAQQKQGQLNKAFNAALGEMQNTIVNIIGEMAKEKGFKVAIPSNQALYADPSLDITDEVLKRLNSRLTKITINFQ
jgi:Skp family chaperone for outer membrane proteins